MHEETSARESYASIGLYRPTQPPGRPSVGLKGVNAILAQARALQRTARTGPLPALLRGKNLGLLCSDDGEHQADTVLFIRAGAELGAHVARIRSTLTSDSTAQDLRRTARLLGQLYDAVECQDLGGMLVHALAAEAGVPVFDRVASPEHPTAALADLLSDETSPADNRRFVVQAVLLVAIG